MRRLEGEGARAPKRGRGRGASTCISRCTMSTASCERCISIESTYAKRLTMSGRPKKMTITTGVNHEAVHRIPAPETADSNASTR